MTKIEWTHPPLAGYARGKSWNPVTGCWGPGGSEEEPRRCPWCYAQVMARRFAGRHGYPETPHHFAPLFHDNRLGEPYWWTKPRVIFVCSMGELFGPWVPDDWAEQVFNVVRDNPRHRFLFLTKWPDHLARWNPWPKNAWAGASATNWETLAVAETYLARRKTIGIQPAETVRFISAEPWLARYSPGGWSLGDRILGGIDWLIVGQQTGPGAKPYSLQSVLDLTVVANEANVPVFMKRLDGWPYQFRREWPMWALAEETHGDV